MMAALVKQRSSLTSEIVQNRNKLEQSASYIESIRSNIMRLFRNIIYKVNILNLNDCICAYRKNMLYDHLFVMLVL